MERNRTRSRIRRPAMPIVQNPAGAAERNCLGPRQRSAISEFQKWDRQMTIDHGQLYYRTLRYTVH